MTIQLLIGNKRTGQIWDVAPCVTTVNYTTERTGTPGKLTFTLVKAGDINFLEGDIVRLTVDGTLVFYGWVFTKSKDRWGIIDVTCYDRIRYLKNNASYTFYDQTATQIINQICGDLQLDIGTLTDTGYVLPSLIEDNQPCIDIIQEALNQTLLNTGTIYVLYDDGNGICLQEAAAMTSDVVIGDKSLLTNYTYKTDIDSQTYNSVKLARPNESAGMADVVTVQDSANIGQWGLLQLYQQVDGDLNTSQMTAQAETSLQFYNRRMRTLKVEALGVVGLRAGNMIRMVVSELGDMALNQLVMLEKVSHTWENSIHTMELETMEL